MPKRLNGDEAENLPVGSFIQYSTVYGEPNRFAVVLGYEGNRPRKIILQTAEHAEPMTFDPYDFIIDGDLELLDQDEALALYDQHKQALNSISAFTREIEREKGIRKGIIE